MYTAIKKYTPNSESDILGGFIFNWKTWCLYYLLIGNKYDTFEMYLVCQILIYYNFRKSINQKLTI